MKEDRWNQRRSMDNGCVLYPSCLDCPEEICKYDKPQPRAQRVSAKVRMEAIKLTMGLPAEQVAIKYGISVRYVNELRRKNRTDAGGSQRQRQEEGTDRVAPQDQE